MAEGLLYGIRSVRVMEQIAGGWRTGTGQEQPIALRRSALDQLCRMMTEASALGWKVWNTDYDRRRRERERELETVTRTTTHEDNEDSQEFSEGLTKISERLWK